MNALVAVNTAPAMSVSDVERVALAIARGGLFGSKDPNAVLTLCLLAQAEGQHPAVVFRDYHIISGKPAKKADAMLRDFITSGGKVEWHQLDDTKADATFTHPAGSARIAWDHDRVKAAQLGNNAMYKKYPRQMLRSRVISEGVRTVFPGATSGLYETNEVEEIVADRPADPVLEATAEPVHNSAPRAKLDGPNTSKTALKKALREFATQLEDMTDIDSFTAWMETEEIVELCKQAERDAPDWWETGEGLPQEFEPLASRVYRKEIELKQVEEIARASGADFVRAG